LISFHPCLCHHFLLIPFHFFHSELRISPPPSHTFRPSLRPTALFFPISTCSTNVTHRIHPPSSDRIRPSTLPLSLHFPSIHPSITPFYRRTHPSIHPSLPPSRPASCPHSSHPRSPALPFPFLFPNTDLIQATTPARGTRL
jgi:hypothetical protein